MPNVASKPLECRLEQRWNWPEIKSKCIDPETPAPGTAVERSSKAGELACANCTAGGPLSDTEVSGMNRYVPFTV